MRFHYPVELSRGARSLSGRGLIGLCHSVTLTSMSGETQEILRGVIERVTFHNEENGFTVARLAPENYTSRLPHWQKEAPVVGTMVGVAVGEAVELRGRWETHPQYGKQFAVSEMRSVLPATVAGIEKYLGSGLIKGVGPVTAKRIVAHFGAETLEVIDNDPQRLSQVGGVGRKRVSMIVAGWVEKKAIKEVMIFLRGHGVSGGLAARIYKRYGDSAVETVQRNPYRLSEDIFGIGFLTADRIGRALGIADDAPQRIAAGVEFALNRARDEGHVYLPSGELIAKAGDLLEVGKEKVAAGLLHLKGADRVKLASGPGQEAEALHWAVAGIFELSSPQPMPLMPEDRAAGEAPAGRQMEDLVQGGQAVYLTPMYYAEMGVGNRMGRLTQHSAAPLAVGHGAGALDSFRAIDWERKFAQLEERASHEPGLPRLAARQRDAVRTALTHRLTVLTGGPGTGKTTVVRTIIDLCEEAGADAVLAAPTGRAAKRLAEATGRAAKTVHRLLQVQPAAGISFKRNEEHPLRGDLLIVDESSMLDLVLTNHLLKAVPPGMSLLLVGDVDQLPSVGAGNVLRDLIAAIEGEVEETRRASQSGARSGAAVVRLDRIFRQSAGSFIVENAHRINRGQMPVLTRSASEGSAEADDFFLFRTEVAERAAQLCVELVTERIPRRFAVPARDIQVLSPMHRGAAGVASLNGMIQQALNPPKQDRAESGVGDRIYRTGDRVMQVRNNYDKDVFNGDMGYIKDVDLIDQRVTVEIDGRPVGYEFMELDELVHAYAISVHKSQGSEFPAVVIPLLTSHYMLLQRNLLYTAVTRAKRLVVLVGQPRAINIAVGNDKVAQRYSGLTERLRRATEWETFA
ncbi:MAG: AAA family ATPase [Caldilineaceae bacterium]|nr:AAA family ATPase [Caldilineaceae bacterium]